MEEISWSLLTRPARQKLPNLEFWDSSAIHVDMNQRLAIMLRLSLNFNASVLQPA